MEHPKWFNLVVLIMVIVIGAVPLLIYVFFFGDVPTVSAREALSILNTPDENAVLIDIRNVEEFNGRHVDGAYLWPFGQIMALHSLEEIPSELKGKTLILLCSSGYQSALATRHISSLGGKNVFHVTGGIQMWVRVGAEYPTLLFSKLIYDRQSNNGYQDMPLYQQVAVILSGFGFKPAHMMISLFLGWLLLRQPSKDLRILGWGMLIFLAAEAACAINYLFFDHNSHLAEYLHSFGMVVAFGFSIFAIQQILDDRVLRISNQSKRCAFADLCKDCYKSRKGECKARNFIQMGSVLLIVMATLPLAAQPITSSYNTSILGSSYHYCRLLLYQFYENRYLPILVILLSGLALLILQVKKDEPVPLLTRLFMVSALAAWLFSFFRLMLGQVFQDALVWADFWEEATELMFVGSVAILLFLFRKEFIQAPLLKGKPLPWKST